MSLQRNVFENFRAFGMVFIHNSELQSQKVELISILCSGVLNSPGAQLYHPKIEPKIVLRRKSIGFSIVFYGV